MILGESLVGYASAFSSGTYFSAGSSSESFPSSRSRMMAIAVKLLVMDAMRNTEVESTGFFVAMSRRPSHAHVHDPVVQDDCPRGAWNVLALRELPHDAVHRGKGGAELRLASRVGEAALLGGQHGGQRDDEGGNVAEVHCYIPRSARAA